MPSQSVVSDYGDVKISRAPQLSINENNTPVKPVQEIKKVSPEPKKRDWRDLISEN